MKTARSHSPLSSSGYATGFIFRIDPDTDTSILRTLFIIYYLFLKYLQFWLDIFIVSLSGYATGSDSGFTDWSGHGCSPDRSQNVVDSFPCQLQSLRRPATMAVGQHTVVWASPFLCQFELARGRKSPFPYEIVYRAGKSIRRMLLRRHQMITDVKTFRMSQKAFSSSLYVWPVRNVIELCAIRRQCID